MIGRPRITALSALSLPSFCIPGELGCLEKHAALLFIFLTFLSLSLSLHISISRITLALCDMVLATIVFCDPDLLGLVQLGS